MSIYEVLGPIAEYKTRFTLKVKQEYIIEVKITNTGYSNQHIGTEIKHGSSDHVVVPDTVKTMFNLTLTQQTKHTVLFTM